MSANEMWPQARNVIASALTSAWAFVLPGCIAGAALDSCSVELEARKFPSTSGLGVTIVIESKERGHCRQVMPISLSVFANSATVNNGEKLESEGLTFSYEERRALVRRGEKTVIDVTLPRAFHTYGLDVAVDQVSGRKIIVLTSITRASTSMYFFGLYGESGEAMYEATIPLGHMWDIQKEPGSILVLGAIRRMEIVIPPSR